MLDSKLVHDLANIHAEKCHGEIKGRKFNLIDCPTSANISLHAYCQIFQNDDLVQSPDEIVNKEKLAYKGGRTEVFKKMFDKKSHKRLYYYDINSAYPSGMLQDMPFEFIKTLTYDDYVIEYDQITDYYLYKAKSKYIGNNKIVIPNLLIRDDKGNLETAEETDYAYHWGNELKEAIRNKFEITISEINEYKPKAIFKEFAEYFYNERLKIKESNESLAIFFKNVLNSLYGKFGQKLFEKTEMCSYDEMCEILNGDNVIMTNYEIIDDKLLISYKKNDDEYNSIGKLIRFASYITSTARCKLSEIMRDVGNENIYYCDTDSIFTSVKPNNKFIDNNILGKWKLECECESAIFLGKKCYTYKTIKNGKDKIIKKAKGADAKLISEDKYYDLLNGKANDVSVTSPMFIKSYDGVKIIKQERKIKPIYNKRQWDGNDSYANKKI